MLVGSGSEDSEIFCKKQAMRLVAAWLDKQNKQMPVTITSTLPPYFAKRGRRTRLTAGEFILFPNCDGKHGYGVDLIVFDNQDHHY